MKLSWRQRAVPLGLALTCYALALAQAPGRQSFDTKVDLHVDPTHFLSTVLSVWSPTGDLGHVQSGQYIGYLFPVGPFFALGRLLSLPDWFVERLWLGTVLAFAAWGIVRLLDALLGRPRGTAAVIAGIAYVLNPYVVTVSNRTTVVLIAYAALPWLLLAVHRGLANPRNWWWPAAFALLVASCGGGVNAATLAWILVGPVLLAAYEVFVDRIPLRAAGSFGWRAVLAAAAASAWWIGGVLIERSYGTNFLAFIEQPGTIWSSTSVSEVLRGMGYWVSYTGVPFAGRPPPVLGSSPTMLFSSPVLICSLLVPALALAGFAWTRRWRYGPFFMALTLAGVLIVAAGFPEGTPLREGLHFIYNRVGVVQFLRTSYKAAPLVMIGIAVLAGCAAQEGVSRLGAGAAARYGLVAGVAAMLAVAAWPLTSGGAIGLRSSGVPRAWHQAATGLDRTLPANSRAIVLPGQLFSFYRWGGTIDPLLPSLTTEPVAQRSVTPWADLHSADLLWTIDGLVEQQRLYPGQLRPLLSLIGVRSVITATDDDRRRSGSVDPTVAATELASQGLGRPTRSYGPTTTFQRPSDQISAPIRLPEVRRYDLPSSSGIVSVLPSGSPTIVDGSAEALAGLSAFGALPLHRAIFYAGDVSSARLRAIATRGAQVVISDSNQRRVFVNSTPFQNFGATVTADDSFSADAALLNPFAGRGTADQTVAVYDGARYIRAPYSPGFPQFPEHRPFAAFDGSPATAWLADRALDPTRRWVEIGFTRPRAVPFVNLLPEDDSRGTVTAVEIAGRDYRVHSGWNHIVLGLHNASALRVAIAAVRSPAGLPAGAGGLREVRIPGVRVAEALRVPQLAQQALAGADLGHVALTYLFERTSGDDPLHRVSGHGPWQAGSTLDAGDGETGLRRLFAPPVARTWRADAWLSLSPLAPDSRLDHLAGYSGRVAAESSGRFLNEGRFRASSAFDGAPGSAWLGVSEPGSRPWISWRLPNPVTVDRLRLVTPRFPVAVPARVSLVVDGRAGRATAVSHNGVVSLASPEWGRSFRLVVLATRLPPGVPRAARARRAVGIAEIDGAGVPKLDVRHGGPLRGGCGIASFAVGSDRVALRVGGDLSALDRGGALPAVQCGPGLALSAGVHLLRADSGVFRIDWLRLHSVAPAGTGPVTGGGQVVDAGHLGDTSVGGVRVSLRGRSWLVLGQSYDRGWRASCDGHSLGEPTVINGYANGWLAPGTCTAVSFNFVPQHVMTWLYVLSAVALALLIGVLLLRHAPAVDEPPNVPIDDGRPTRRLPAGRAVAFGLLAGAVLGFIFGIRAGIVIAPTVALICWRGVGARALTLVAGGLLAIAVPAIYLIRLPARGDGFDVNYALHLIDGHWIAVAAVVLLFAALVRALSEARSSRTSTA